MQKMFFAFTMDSIMHIFFGRKTETMQGEADVYATAFDEAHRHLIEYSLTSVPIFVLSAFLPYPFGYLRLRPGGLAIDVLRMFHRNSKPFHDNVDILSKESSKIIQNRKKDPNLSESNDLLALFMRTDMQPPDEESSRPYTEKQLRDIVLSFIIAGRDTTACLLTWLFYMLSQNKDVEHQLLEEIDRVLEGKQATRENTAANRTGKCEYDGSQMPYLNGVVYEALRLYPPVPEDIKICVEEDPRFPDGKGGTFTVPEGTRMVFMPR
jgi:cytochrome P450